ncbi:hypothetical protein O3M35_000429 [Rhynocoris fuscipes]|uniref:Uncharacterized protein n=1 Tax=Rhynocoris fuscipes TaxID=488301 RepID=A0AAW1DRF2_9HEMI
MKVMVNGGEKVKDDNMKPADNEVEEELNESGKIKDERVDNNLKGIVTEVGNSDGPKYKKLPHPSKQNEKYVKIKIENTDVLSGMILKTKLSELHHTLLRLTGITLLYTILMFFLCFLLHYFALRP